MIGIGANLDIKAVAHAAAMVVQSGASLEFDFSTASANPKAGNATLMCTRSGATATRVNAAGQIEACAANDLRFDHDPTTLQYENIIPYSEAFNNWSLVGATVTQNAVVGYDGSARGDKLVESSGGTTHSASVVGVMANSTQYTVAIDAKAGERSIILLGAVKDDSNFVGRYFDLSSGTSTASFSSPDSYSITSLGNGWYRCIVTLTNAATGSSDSVGVYLVSTGTTFSYSGDGASGVYLSRANLNSGSTALTYRKTNGTAFAKWYACKGILIEEQRTNLFVRSEEFDNASWGKVNATISANNTTAPDGNLTADKFVQSSAVAYMQQAVAVSAGYYTISAFGKANAAGDYLALLMQPAYADRVGARFDLNAGTVVGASTPGGSGSSNVSATITAFPNGWYRCTLTALLPTNAGANHYIGPSDSTQSNNDPFGSSTLRSPFVWGAQFEAGSFATSYIPTISAAVTRNADLHTFVVGPWFNQSEGTMLVQFDTATVSSAGRVVSIDDGAVTSNSMDITVTAAAKVALEGVASGVYAGSVTGTPSITANTSTKVCARYSATTTDAVSTSGTTAVTGTVTFPTSGLTTVRLGHQSNGVHLNGHITRFAYWNSILANADMATLAA